MKPTDKQKKVVAPASARVRPKTPADNIPGTIPIRFSAIIFNVVGAIVSAMLIMTIFQHHDPDPANPTETHLNSGYDWLLNTMLAGNLKTIEENPDKTIQQKYEMKWGQGEITYTERIKTATPENAIILLPPKKIIQDIGFKSIIDLPWITYFLYPRQIVYGDSVSSPLYHNATYLVSMNGWGLDKIGYTGEKQPFMILPIKK